MKADNVIWLNELLFLAKFKLDLKRAFLFQE